MKKHILLSAALCGTLVLLGTVSCQKQDLPEARQECSFTVYAPPATSPQLQGGTAVWFKSGDQLSMISRSDNGASFDKTKCVIDRFSTTESGAQATFTGSFSASQQSKVYVFHPYTSYAASSGSNGYVSYRAVSGTSGDRNTIFYVPNSPLQRAVANDFPVDYTTAIHTCWGGDNPPLNIAYGIIADRTSSTEFHMHNACALLKFSIAGSGITSADFRFSETEAISAYRVQIGFDESNGDAWLNTVPWSGQGEANTVRVYPPAGNSTFPAGTYYAVVARVKTAAPPTVTLRKAGQIASFTGSTDVTLNAGEILPLGTKALDAIADEKDAWTAFSDDPLDLTLDFSKGADGVFTTAIPTASTAFKKGGVDFTLSQGGTNYVFKFLANDQGSYNYDSTNSALRFVSGASYNAIMRVPAIPGRRLTKITFTGVNNASGSKVIVGANASTSYLYKNITFTDNTPTDITLTTVPANGNVVYFGLYKGSFDVSFKSIVFRYE
ncbi:MAG: hypothetical protein IJV01_06695 [Bacteroidales bacterium]|nr:hypothetical protein [Bacteroidales bacterium]